MRHINDWGWVTYKAEKPKKKEKLSVFTEYNVFLSQEEMFCFFNTFLGIILKKWWRQYNEENLNYYQDLINRIQQSFSISWKNKEKLKLKYSEKRDILFLAKTVWELLEKWFFDSLDKEEKRIANSIPSMLMLQLRKSIESSEYEHLTVTMWWTKDLSNETRNIVQRILDWLKRRDLIITKKGNFEEFIKDFYRQVLRKKYKWNNTLNEDELIWFIKYLQLYRRWIDWIELSSEIIALQASTQDSSNCRIYNLKEQKSWNEISFLVYNWVVIKTFKKLKTSWDNLFSHYYELKNWNRIHWIELDNYKSAYINLKTWETVYWINDVVSQIIRYDWFEWIYIINWNQVTLINLKNWLKILCSSEWIVPTFTSRNWKVCVLYIDKERKSVIINTETWEQI